MSALDIVGARDGWRCWLCDEPVDPTMSVNDSRGPSIDQRITKTKAKKKGTSLPERLAHRGCNTGKGGTTPEVAWSDALFVVDPAPILTTVERLERKGGREIMGRCPTQADAEDAATWLVDRVSRLFPDLAVSADIDAGGGQYLVSLRTI